MTKRPKETEIYGPIKAMLNKQGFDVKGEIGDADVFALRPDDTEPVIVELKSGFSLNLFHQAIARQAISDSVYVAVPTGRGRAWLSSLKSNTGLCRRLGLGLITVRQSDQTVQIHCDPAPFRPRKSPPKRARMLKEFAKRQGDPTPGGASRHSTLITAYRQDALRLAADLQKHGASKGADVKARTGVAQATRMMRDNHYGWFLRLGLGVYDLTEAGRTAIHAAQ